MTTKAPGPRGGTTESEASRAWRHRNAARIAARRRASYAKNIERERANNIRKRNKNIEKAREQSRQWRIANPEKNKAAMARWAQEDPERKRESGRRSYQKHRAKRTKAWRQYARTPQGKARIAAAKARRRTHEPTRHHPPQVAEMLRKARRCHYCQARFTKENPPTLDHITPLAKGGTHTLDNLIAACRTCNCSKGKKDPTEYAKKIGRLLI